MKSQVDAVMPIERSEPAPAKIQLFNLLLANDHASNPAKNRN